MCFHERLMWFKNSHSVIIKTRLEIFTNMKSGHINLEILRTLSFPAFKIVHPQVLLLLHGKEHYETSTPTPSH
jgi:hypothetical protein